MYTQTVVTTLAAIRLTVETCVSSLDRIAGVVAPHMPQPSQCRHPPSPIAGHHPTWRLQPPTSHQQQGGNPNGWPMFERPFGAEVSTTRSLQAIDPCERRVVQRPFLGRLTGFEPATT